MDKSITYVGLDVHKDTIAVALAEAGAHKDVREYGKIANTATALNARRRSCRALEASYGSVMRPALAAMAFNGS